MKSIDIIKRSKIWLGISTVLVIASIVSIAVFGLNFGIDFTGGSLLEVKVDTELTSEDIQEVYAGQGFEVTPQASEDGVWLVRSDSLNPEQREAMLNALDEKSETLDELRFEMIGPVIGEELKRKSIIAVALLLGLIVLYVAWAFRKVSKPVASWKYGLLTIVAATHDVIIPLGIFAILGSVIGYEIDTAFVAAMLTILGYSINDTIVVFDRTRENLLNNRHSEKSFGTIVNRSVVQSFGRSINTSVTTLLVLLAIFFFGAATVQSFVLALIIGILSGAYSSIFLASPLLVMWNKRGK